MPLWNASPKVFGLRTVKARGLRGKASPRDFARQIQRRRPAHLGLRGRRRGRPEAQKDWRPTGAPGGASVASGRQVSRVRGAPEALGHVLWARGACRGPRAKPAGGVRACAPRPPRPHNSPGARPPGGGGRCRVRAVLDREPQGGCGRQVPRGPHWRVRAASSSRAARACLCWRQCAGTGWEKLRAAGACWRRCPGAVRRGLTDTGAGPRTGERATEGHLALPTAKFQDCALPSAARPHSGPGVSRLSRCPSPGLWSASSWDGCGLRRDRWDRCLQRKPCAFKPGSWLRAQARLRGPGWRSGFPSFGFPPIPLPRLVHPRESSPGSVRPSPLPYLFMVIYLLSSKKDL